MSVVGGQMNNIQPSCVVGQPMKQLTMNGHIQAERSCTVECICVLYDPVLKNHVSSEITDDLINTSVMSCQKSIIVEPSTRERARNVLEKTITKVNEKENHLGSVLRSCIKCFILNVHVKD